MSVAPFDHIKKELSGLYPISKYSSLKGDGKALAFHILLPSKQSDAFILKWYEGCKQNAKYINFRDDLKRLSPLDVAIMTEREVIVEVLCNNPLLTVDGEDIAGWSPKQHAIARNNPKILALVSAVFQKQFLFIQKVLSSTPPKEEEIVVSFEDSKGTVRPLTQAEFKQMTKGALFFDGLLGSTNALYYNWGQSQKVKQDEQVTKAHKDLLKNGSPLVLCEEKGIGYGVKTNRAVKTGEIVVVYGSELVEPVEETDARFYATRLVDGKKIRNLGAMINDGFPNVMGVAVSSEGISLEAFMANEPIEAGNALYANYGPTHSVKWRPRKKLGNKALLRDFPKGFSFLKELEAVRNSDLDSVTRSGRVAKISYIFHTPSVLFSLVALKHFDFMDIRKTLEDELFAASTFSSTRRGVEIVNFYGRTLGLIGDFEKMETKETYREWLVKSFEVNPLAAVIGLEQLLDTNKVEVATYFMLAAASYFSFVNNYSTNREADLERLKAIPKGIRLRLIDFCRKIDMSPPCTGHAERIAEVMAL